MNNINTGDAAIPLKPTETLYPLSARRLLLLGGIALVLIGMIFGDIFAVFVLHQNAARVGVGLANAVHAAAAGDAALVLANFQNVGDFLENRGTKVDTHVHIIAFGYLALAFSLLVPWIGLSVETQKRLAWLYLCGAGLLPVCVFLIHYVGLAYSPLKAIGWASIFADTGGLFVIVAVLGYLFGLVNWIVRLGRPAVPDEVLLHMSRPGRLLLGGGLFLILLGFLHGSYYAAVDLYHHEAAEYSILLCLNIDSARQNTTDVERGLAAYGELQADKAVKIAAHAHIIEFGMLSMLLAFFQPYVNLNENWKRRWALVLLAGSLVLPVCVLLELKYGLIAGAFADVGGVLVIVALLAMWIGIVRYTGRLDAVVEHGRSA